MQMVISRGQLITKIARKYKIVPSMEGLIAFYCQRNDTLKQI